MLKSFFFFLICIKSIDSIIQEKKSHSIKLMYWISFQISSWSAIEKPALNMTCKDLSSMLPELIPYQNLVKANR